MSDRAETTRRDFLRAGACGAALAALGAVAAALVLGDRDGCARRRRCDDCPLLADCRLPAAETARKEARAP